MLKRAWIATLYSAISITLLAILPTKACAQNSNHINIYTEMSPPNQLLLNGKVHGSSTDIVRRIFKHANIEHTIHMQPWARALYNSQTKANSFIYSIARNKERESQYHWLAKVAFFELGFVTLKENNEIYIDDLEQARYFTVAVQRNDIAEQLIRQTGATVVLTQDITHSYQLLLNKKVDLVIDDKKYIHNMASQFHVAVSQFRFVYAIKELSVYGYLAANINTDPKLIKRLEDAVKEVTSDTSWYEQLLYHPYEYAR